MGFVSTHCPACGKAIQVPTDAPLPRCMYCGADVPLHSAAGAAHDATVVNLLGLARTASLGGNAAEAESYYTRVLELNPAISEAWLGKGKSAAWQSSLSHIRLPEMLVAFSHAIATSTDSERAETLEICVAEVNQLVATLYGMANQHLHEFVALQDSYESFVRQVQQLLSALDTALTWAPSHRLTLENIVHLCKDSIEGVAYRDAFDNDAPKAWHLTPASEAVMRQRLEAAARRLKEVDPSYSAPAAEAKKPDACFVVTATMGRADHPNVATLRQFRDVYMRRSPSGRAFIRWYYIHGPRLADLIAGSPGLRAISQAVVVTPAAWVARATLQRR